MQVSAILLVRDLKDLLRRGRYRSLVQHVEYCIFRKADFQEELSADSLCLILMLEQKAVNALFKKNNQRKDSFPFQVIFSLVRISSRNFQICYRIILENMKTKVGYLQERNSKTQKINTSKNGMSSKKQLKKMVKKFIDLLLTFILSFCLQLKTNDCSQYFKILKELEAVLKDQNFLPSLLLTPKMKIKKYQLLIFYYNTLTSDQQLIKLQAYLCRALCEIVCDLQTVHLRKKKFNHQTFHLEKIERQIKNILLIGLISSIKKDLTLNKFSTAMEGLRFFGEILESFTDIPDLSRALFNEYTQILYLLGQFDSFWNEEKIISYLINYTPQIQLIIKKNNKHSKAFDINQYFRRNIDKYLPFDQPKKEEQYVIDQETFEKYEKKFTRANRGSRLTLKGLIQIKKKFGSLSKSIKSSIEKNPQQKIFLQKNEDQMMKKSMTQVRVPKKYIFHKNIQKFSKNSCNYEKMIKLSISNLIKQKNSKSILSSLNTSFNSELESMDQTYQDLKKDSFLNSTEKSLYKLKIRNKSPEISQINNESFIEGKKKHIKLQIFVNLLCKNKEKINLQKYCERMIFLQNKNLSRQRKDQKIEQAVNFQLNKISSYTFTLSRRRKREKSPGIQNSENEQKIDEQFLKQKSYELSKKSIQHNLQKLINKQESNKEKQNGYQLVKKRQRKREAYFTPLV